MTSQCPGLGAVPGDIAMAVNRNLASIQQRNAYIFDALSKHFPSLRFNNHVEIRALPLH